MQYTLYEVGGKVRDGLLNIQSNDVDYTVVIDPEHRNEDPQEVFKKFSLQLSREGFKVFLETPEFYTIRARFPEDHKYSGVADFVLARKETGYIEGTRCPIVIIGNLMDDLGRRDFTVNALAKSQEGVIVDYFNGMEHLEKKILVTPESPEISISDDPLRILRAFRFSTTLGFRLCETLVEAISNFEADKFSVISDERIRDEIGKIFKFNTFLAFDTFENLKGSNHQLYLEIFNRDFWLYPTNKK